jgi:hypothetical protein
MNDTMTAAHEAGWNCGAMLALAPHLPTAICGVVLSYAADVRRVYFEGIFHIHRPCLGPPNLMISRDVTKLSCRLKATNMGVWRAWSLVYGLASCREFRGTDPTTHTARPLRPPTFAPAIPPQELWDFMAGADSPTMRTLVSGYSDGFFQVIIIGFRRDLRTKAARWCAAHECAAIAKVRFGLD